MFLKDDFCQLYYVDSLSYQLYLSRDLNGLFT
jgi:hypothetical protein